MTLLIRVLYQQTWTLYAIAKNISIIQPFARHSNGGTPALKHEKVRISREMISEKLYRIQRYKDSIVHVVQTFEGRELKVNPLESWPMLLLPAARAATTVQRPLQWALRLAALRKWVTIINNEFYKISSFTFLKECLSIFLRQFKVTFILTIL